MKRKYVLSQDDASDVLIVTPDKPTRTLKRLKKSSQQRNADKSTRDSTKPTQPSTNTPPKSPKKPSTSFQCGICLVTFTSLEQRGVLPCPHEFCFLCISHWAQINNSCPLCKRVFREIITRNHMHRVKDTNGAPSLLATDYDLLLDDVTVGQNLGDDSFICDEIIYEENNNDRTEAEYEEEGEEEGEAVEEEDDGILVDDDDEFWQEPNSSKKRKRGDDSFVCDDILYEDGKVQKITGGKTKNSDYDFYDGDEDEEDVGTPSYNQLNLVPTSQIGKKKSAVNLSRTSSTSSSKKIRRKESTENSPDKKPQQNQNHSPYQTKPNKGLKTREKVKQNDERDKHSRVPGINISRSFTSFSSSTPTPDSKKKTTSSPPPVTLSGLLRARSQSSSSSTPTCTPFSAGVSSAKKSSSQQSLTNPDPSQSSVKISQKTMSSSSNSSSSSTCSSTTTTTSSSCSSSCPVFPRANSSVVKLRESFSQKTQTQRTGSSTFLFHENSSLIISQNAKNFQEISKNVKQEDLPEKIEVHEDEKQRKKIPKKSKRKKSSGHMMREKILKTHRQKISDEETSGENSLGFLTTLLSVTKKPNLEETNFDDNDDPLFKDDETDIEIPSDVTIGIPGIPIASLFTQPATPHVPSTASNNNSPTFSTSSSSSTPSLTPHVPLSTMPLLQRVNPSAPLPPSSSSSLPPSLLSVLYKHSQCPPLPPPSSSIPLPCAPPPCAPSPPYAPSSPPYAPSAPPSSLPSLPSPPPSPPPYAPYAPPSSPSHLVVCHDCDEGENQSCYNKVEGRERREGEGGDEGEGQVAVKQLSSELTGDPNHGKPQNPQFLKNLFSADQNSQSEEIFFDEVAPEQQHEDHVAEQLPELNFPENHEQSPDFLFPEISQQRLPSTVPYVSDVDSQSV